MKRDGMRALLAQICAGAGAAGLVVAFACAVLMPLTTSLAEIVARFGHGWITDWLSTRWAAPFMVRPAWLLPAGLGLVLCGGAVSLDMGRAR